MMRSAVDNNHSAHQKEADKSEFADLSEEEQLLEIYDDIKAIPDNRSLKQAVRKIVIHEAQEKESIKQAVQRISDEWYEDVQNHNATDKLAIPPADFEKIVDQQLRQVRGLDNEISYTEITGFRDINKVTFSQDNVIYDHVETNKSKSSFSREKLWQLMEWSLGRGQGNMLIKIETEKDTVENTALRPLDPKETRDLLDKICDTGSNHIVKKIAEKFGIQTTQSNKDKDKESPLPSSKIVDNIVESVSDGNPIILEPTAALPASKLTRISNHLDLVKEILTDGITLDDRLLINYASDVVTVDPTMEDLSPRDAAIVNGHKILITNSGTGKSVTAERVNNEETISRPTESNLLGFGTADDPKVGKLNDRAKTAFLDELQETSPKETLGNLKSQTDTGRSFQGRGGGQSCRSYCQIAYLGNPGNDPDIDERAENRI